MCGWWFWSDWEGSEGCKEREDARGKVEDDAGDFQRGLETGATSSGEYLLCVCTHCTCL